MQKIKTTRLRFGGILAALVLLAGLVGCNGGGTTSGQSLPVQSVAGTNPGSKGTTLPPTAINSYTALPLPDEMRAMWVSFLEWDSAEIATEPALHSYAATLFSNCKQLGINTVIVAVRGFADAFYQSEVYPWSHLITGTQGQPPGFDPLAILVEEAHSHSLRIEAMVNPYRARHGMYKDVPLAENNPASLHPQWTREVNGTLWFNPALPEVTQLIVQGVREIAANYNVDGIQFDDYFYPGGIDESFDAEEYAAAGGGKSLADWRRENISGMVRQAYTAIKAANPTASFGISPAGNNQNNRDASYADVNLWMSTPGYVDYIMPQLYWGFNYQSTAGSTAAAFANKCTEWAGLPRTESVRLYAGLAAYAVQEGDGSAGDQSEWASGHILADMVAHLRSTDGFSGFALFRYAYLYNGSEAAGKELAALQAVLP
ncbi:family 10 glycosylhydrolase [Ruminococcaceae bacterium OttesenSCG-928-A16]|nr:family 10 glycosylhydrolase [Ruminococcaceae bacterium OttesenSCG-928-A16]